MKICIFNKITKTFEDPSSFYINGNGNIYKIEPMDNELVKLDKNNFMIGIVDDNGNEFIENFL